MRFCAGCFALLILGCIGWGDPIAVSGTGTYNVPYLDNSTCNLSFSGLEVFVSFSEEMPLPGVPNCSFGGVPPSPYPNYDKSGYAELDGTSSQYFDFNFGANGGELTLYDVTGDIIAEADLSGYYAESSPMELAPNDPVDFDGTITISPTPEPASWGMVGIAGLTFWIWRTCGKRQLSKTQLFCSFKN